MELWDDTVSKYCLFLKPFLKKNGCLLQNNKHKNTIGIENGIRQYNRRKFVDFPSQKLEMTIDVSFMTDEGNCI